MKRLGSTTVEAGQYADPDFSAQLIAWQKRKGRHTLPWQNTRDAYRIWVSEIMLQQTQVSAVIAYYQRFLERFPDVKALAAADVSEVMACWSGLGYYSRARNLHRCARIVVEQHGGRFPEAPEALFELPGIGRSTAAAIAAFAYGARAAILDGNVKRVFCRVFGIDGFPGQKQIEDLLWQRASALLPERDIESYTQGLMDLGATVCSRGKPSCANCPMAQRCIALKTDRVLALPVRRPKKPVPQRAAAMLILIHDGQLVLEQRPPSGIWGGLLSLPEVLSQDPENAILENDVMRWAANFGVPESAQALPVLTHGFTHFTLHISPWLVRMDSRKIIAGEAAQFDWHPMQDLGAAALPAPVKKLLLQLTAEPDLFAMLA